MVGRDGATVWVLLGRLISPLCCSPVCLLSAVGASAQAPAPTRFDQDRLRRWELFVQGGAYFSNRIGGLARGVVAVDPQTGATSPIRQDIRYDRTGRLFTGLRFALTSEDQIEASYSYSVGRAKNRQTALPPISTVIFEGVFALHYVSFNYVRALPAHGRFRPFVTAGAGFVSFEDGAGIRVKPAGNFGGGFKIALTTRLYLLTDQRIFVSPPPKTATFSTTTRTFVNYAPTLGLVLRF